MNMGREVYDEQRLETQFEKTQLEPEFAYLIGLSFNAAAIEIDRRYPNTPNYFTVPQRVGGRFYYPTVSRRIFRFGNPMQVIEVSLADGIILNVIKIV